MMMISQRSTDLASCYLKAAYNSIMAMARVMNVERISKETIKPSSPTPLHLRRFNLSLIDQLSPSVYLPLVLFYRYFGDDNDHIVKFTEMSQCLKRSLSKTLTQFFPLAGKIKNNIYVDCNDDGVDYFEAHVDCLLDDVLEQPEADILTPLVPVDDTSLDAGVGCPLLVQINLFKCGGIGVGVSITHKLCDAATLSTFFKAWSAATLGSGEQVIPDFTTATLIPPGNDVPNFQPVWQAASNKCITKRFLFDASKIAALKAKAASASVPTPTRVEAVTALIGKCAMAASRSTSNGSIDLYVLGHGMNMRKRIVPPLSENSFGNFVGIFAVQSEVAVTNLETLVEMLRKEITDFSGKLKLKRENVGSIWLESLIKAEHFMKTKGIEVYSFTSWCRYPVYEVDFGWGTPAWVGVAMSPHKNFTALMDTRDGNGVNAYVCLTKEEMALFERDPDLLAFASVNPSMV